MIKFFNNKNKQKGFTLIEMMVSVSIFVIVAFVVVSTLLTMSYTYKKAQKMRILMDNLGFSIQSMSINIREGVDYKQGGCPSGTCIQFKPIDSWLSSPVGDNVRYYLDDTSLMKCMVSDFGGSSCITNTISVLTSPEIKITKLNFLIVDKGIQPLKKVKIIISGKAGSVPRELTTFFIQNTISQRSLGG